MSTEQTGPQETKGNMNDARLRQHDPSQGRSRLNLIDEKQMTPDKDAAIRQLLCACFPEDVAVFSQTRYWHGSGPEFSLTEESQGNVVGHIGIVVREVNCGGNPLRIAGVQNLAVAPKLRGTGLGGQLVSQSMAEAKRRGLKYGLLFCIPELRKFYGSLDWFTLDVDVTMRDEQGAKAALPAKNICMATCLDSAAFPHGDIDLQGADW